jgi:putative ABC transport system permease protein
VFYAGYGLAIAAALLLGPVLSLSLARALRPALKALRPVEGSLAADSLIQSPRRTSATVSALMLSLALIVAFAGMAQASYGSVIDWMNTTLNPDLFVMPSQRLDVRTTRFPASMALEIAAIPGIARVQSFRNGRISFRNRTVMVAALEMSSVGQTARVAPVAGDASTMYGEAAAGKGLIVSDNLAQLEQLSLGDVLDIPAPYGTISLPIVGILTDYTDQQGTIFLERALFVDRWRDDSVSDFRVYVTPGADVGEVRRQIVAQYAGRRQVFVLTHDEARNYVVGITDQWFGVMNVQIAIAVLVAVLGIVNSLTVSIADRRRELGVLQAVGALRGQIRRTIWMEALAVSVLGLILGTVLGAVNLYYILEIVRRDVAGMRLDYDFPVTTVLALAPLMLGTAFVAALWPAETALRGSLVEALEYE